MGSEFARCSRYRSAGRQPVGRRERQLLLISAGLGGLLLLATCVFIGILALTLGNAQGGGFLARVTQTPTASPSSLPTEVVTPTLTATSTPTPTLTSTTAPSPTPSPTLFPTWTPAGAFTSPLATPTPSATARPTTPWNPPASPTPRPSNTPTPSRTPTATNPPTATLTRTPTALPVVNCRTDDLMTFDPATPMFNTTYTIQVMSEAAYPDVSLVVSPIGSTPVFQGVSTCGSYYCWRWTDLRTQAGDYTYSFKIRNGYATCKSGTVSVEGPTATPTAFYDFGLIGIGPDRQSGPPGTVVNFQINLHNGGSREDTYLVWAQKDAAVGWPDVQYCIGDLEHCYQPNDAQPVVVPAGGADQPLFIKATIPSPIPTPPTTNPAIISIWVQSSYNNAKKSYSVKIDIE